jgi:ribA/ribD-fused uncharacterized protein
VTAIERFSGRYRFLSNFYPSPLQWEEMFFATAEHAFNAGKTVDGVERIRVMSAPTPAEAKRIGRAVTLRPGWDEVERYRVMREVLEQKFADQHLAGLLLATGDAELVEGNDWHDTHWGVCSCRRHNGVGDNHLGRMLMEVRAQLRHHGRQR